VKKGDCGATFKRPCTLADRNPPSCNAGLKEDFGAKECVPMRAGHSAFFDGLLSLTNEVAKGSAACEAFLIDSASVQKAAWFGPIARATQAAGNAGKALETGQSCSRYLAIGFICAAPSQAKKVGAPVEIYNNLADAYESKTCAPETQASGWPLRPAKLLGPSRGLDCPYDSNTTSDPRGGRWLALGRAQRFTAAFFDPIRDPTRSTGVGSCWACPEFTFRSGTSVLDPGACLRGDKRFPQLRAMCATFTVFVDRGVKPLQCLDRLIKSVVADAESGDGGKALCTTAGALAFDQAVDLAIGRVDPASSAKKLADAIVKVRKTLKGPAVAAKINEEARKIPACQGLFK
jgi:hypothetical protein